MRNSRDSKLLFELSESGRRAHRLPPCDVPEQSVTKLLPKSALAQKPPALPELSEPQVVRHFANLSQLNMSVDTHFYPLGSCTMKYNPKRNERIARLPGFADLHPYQPEQTLQGMLQLLYEMQQYFQEISGLDVCSLQPAAGAHGELKALLVAFSRRMCCSRVCSVRTKQRRPRRSTVWPTNRPGMRRKNGSRQAMIPKYGPP